MASGSRGGLTRRPDAGDPTTWEFRWLDQRGREVTGGYEVAKLAALELVAPMRTFVAYKGQRNYLGSYYCSRSRRLLPTESRLEKLVLKSLTFDTRTVAMATQPLRVWAGGRALRYPDIAVRRLDGTLTIIDVMAAEQAEVESRVRKSLMMRLACETCGWGYEVLHAPPPDLAWNLVWLAGYKHRPALHSRASELLQWATRPVTIADLMRWSGEEAIARPLTMHLMWTRALLFDESRRIDEDTLVWTAS